MNNPASEFLSTIVVGVSAAPDVVAAPFLKVAEPDRHVVNQALALAAKCGARIHLVHVIDSVDDMFLDEQEYAPLSEVVKASLTPAFEAFRERAAAEGVELTYGWRSGRPWRELIQCLYQQKADLLMISRRREALGALQRIIYGSSARRLLRKAPCSVCVVDSSRPIGFRKVLALVDRTAVSGQVMESAGAIADLTGAERHVLHSLEFPADIALRRVVDARRALKRYHESMASAAQEDLVKLTGGDDRWHTELSTKWVAEAAADAVKKDKVDLIVLSSVSKTGLAGIVMGTTAEAVLERAAVSAWLIRPPGWRSPIPAEPRTG